VSWSAIAQIEAGRRKDVRLSSLAALADALGMSVDHLIGTAAAAVAPQLFEHRALPYRSDAEFVAGVTPFLEQGIEQSERLLAVTTDEKTRLLREALGARSGHVEFAGWDQWYQSPKHALGRYAAFLEQAVSAGAIWIRVVAEAAWAGDTVAEIETWTRYESLVNLVFASSPASILCTYDESAFAPAVVAQAHTTHPEIARGAIATASPHYQRPEDLLLNDCT
jgi:transcriptional regulator with XRE-family HTH domain